MRLITIPVSHYCEKARWALDRAGLLYREERHLQMFHRLPLLRLGGLRTVPVAVTPEGVLADSHAILDYADARLPDAERLYPSAIRDRVLDWERRLDDDFGVEARRLFYDQLIRAPRRFVLAFNNARAPAWQQVAFGLGLPAARAFLVRYLEINEASLARARERVQGTLDEVAAALGDGRPFLCGDRFTAADLTFASLSAPVSAPAEYGPGMPALGEFPPETQRYLQAYAEHPAVRFARHLYTSERHRVARGPE
ncbi:MAG: glutathione S-transferase family protein [Deltaproteobacteria bacterium]|nr:glutathione S-transferase family protein [Deltaproteobacteria bacterium]MBW2416241.1 glutathione S-transferase family protein [Deltaproteobacteria bacterium]